MKLPLFIQLVVAVLVAFLLAMLVIVPALNPPAEDVQNLFFYMGSSGLVTVGLTYLLYQQRMLQRFLSLRGALFAIIVLTVVLIFINVWITARLMFIKEHDLVLTTGLLIFAGVIAAVSTFFIARTLRERISELSKGVQALARSDWKVRLPVVGNDDLSELAMMFNKMATDLEEVEEQKRQVEQMRRDLIAWASHDLRTPLAAIRAMNEAMMDGVVSDPDTVKRYQQNMQNEITHMGQLINDLFDLAQLDTGHIPLRRQTTSLHDLVSDTLSNMNARAKAHSVKLSAHVDPTVDMLYVAPDKVQRILYNLIDNALEYTPSGGEVSLNARGKNQQAEISIHNSGSYIPEADLPNVFKSFYRGEQSRAQTSDGRRGTGLGLAIVRGFVEAHGGTIRVESQPDKGTTFVFTLPKVEAGAIRMGG
ncbi:MAG: HAMP domain-containing protein [Anaerolineaceae bacterium]|nr:HAMP domain-containing protein [Anaerolineaceae bacterium]